MTKAPDVIPSDARRVAANASLLAELAQADTHLENGALTAKTVGAPAVAESIAAVELQAKDLMRAELRGLRLAAHVTQAELGRRVGVRPRAISDFETGTRRIPPELALRVSEALHVALRPRAFTSTSPAGRSSVFRQARIAVAGEDTRAFEIVASDASMEPAIRHGDKLLVSHEVDLTPGRVVVAIHDGSWIVKRLTARNRVLVLRSDNADEEVELSAVNIQGVVVEIHRMI